MAFPSAICPDRIYRLVCWERDTEKDIPHSFAGQCSVSSRRHLQVNAPMAATTATFHLPPSDTNWSITWKRSTREKNLSPFAVSSLTSVHKNWSQYLLLMANTFTTVISKPVYLNFPFTPWLIFYSGPTFCLTSLQLGAAVHKHYRFIYWTSFALIVACNTICHLPHTTE